MQNPLIKQIDHLIIRVDEAEKQDALLELFTDTLQLPLAWPYRTHDFKTAGVFFGNVNVELAYMPDRDVNEEVSPVQDEVGADYYGIAFEPESLADSLAELEERKVPHSAPASLHIVKNEERTRVCTNLFLNHLLNKGRGIQQPFPDEGTAFLCEYNPDFNNVLESRKRLAHELQKRAGGALGLLGVEEVAVAYADYEGKRRAWDEVMQPNQGSKGYWRLAEGPAIQLVPYQENKILFMTLRVSSLEQAKTYLQEKSLLGEEQSNQITIARDQVYGLNIVIKE